MTKVPPFAVNFLKTMAVRVNATGLTGMVDGRTQRGSQTIAIVPVLHGDGSIMHFDLSGADTTPYLVSQSSLGELTLWLSDEQGYPLEMEQGSWLVEMAFCFVKDASLFQPNEGGGNAASRTF